MKKSTNEKNRLKRKALRKQMHYGKVRTIKNVMRTPDQVKAGQDFARQNQAKYEKVRKIEEKAERKRLTKKGIDYDTYIADRKRQDEADAKARAEARKAEAANRTPAGILTKSQIKRGFVKRVCKCGNVVIGRGISELWFCGKCGRLSKEASKNYITVKKGAGFSVMRKDHYEIAKAMEGEKVNVKN